METPDRVQRITGHLCSAPTTANEVVTPDDVKKMSIEQVRERFSHPSKDPNALEIFGVNVSFHRLIGTKACV